MKRQVCTANPSQILSRNCSEPSEDWHYIGLVSCSRLSRRSTTILTPLPRQCFLATTLTFPVSVTAAKLSILFFYHRIFIERRFRIASITIGVVTIAWFITFIFLQFFDCIPFAYYWNRTIPHGHCINPVIISIYGVGIGDVATNIAILVLPIPSLLGLQMPWQRKTAIILIFLLGSLYEIAARPSVVRQVLELTGGLSL